MMFSFNLYRKQKVTSNDNTCVLGKVNDGK